MISLFNQLAESWCVVLFRCFRSVVLKLWYARAFKVVREQLSCHIRKALLIRFCVIIRSCVMLIRLFAILILSTFWANCVLLKPGVYTPTLKKHQAVRDLKKFENHCPRPTSHLLNIIPRKVMGNRRKQSSTFTEKLTQESQRRVVLDFYRSQYRWKSRRDDANVRMHLSPRLFISRVGSILSLEYGADVEKAFEI